ncbi:programmed cell death protein 2-like isoform X2 [Struthio camelus]|uniref:programmed cell death protein 2-like isoform X2 n=1 Tax=Struthio camelus TaxID=8801 RepID=UPI003603F30D
MAATAARGGRPPVLLGLRDAPMAAPSRGGGQAPAWATNKLGGCADAVPSVRLGCPGCGVCGAALLHLLQVYCPLEASPYHRVANVFACAGKGCWGKPQSWKVLRSQCLQTEEEEARDRSVKQKQESNFAAKDWCDEADDWGVSDEAESPAYTSLQLLGLNEAMMSNSSSREVECASQFQQLRLSEATDVSGPLNHADELLKEYQQREGVDLERLMSESFAGEGGNEKYEKSEVKSRDHTFHKFMKRISVCHEQILRYSWGGQPLFITCPPANINKGIPACSNCGSNRVFEFQLMPALVSMLQSDTDLSVEFGTVIVYTCERSCWPTNHQTPLEEFIFVQEDPDQKLFK